MMQLIRFFYALLIGAFLLSSCQNNNQIKYNEIIEIDSAISPLENISWQDTLMVVVTFSECGEWGGHREYLSIQLDSASRRYARLIIDSVNCDSLIRYSPEEKINRYSRQQIYDSTKYLTLEDEYLISKMLQNVLQAYLIGAEGANFGDHYVVKTSDESLNLSFSNIGNYHIMDYRETTDKIFGRR